MSFLTVDNFVTKVWILIKKLRSRIRSWYLNNRQLDKSEQGHAWKLLLDAMIANSIS